MGIAGAFKVEPETHLDLRGSFHELIRCSTLEEVSGWGLEVRQVNVSTSRQHTLRGIHSTKLPPGQSKFVTCVGGRALDIAVDLRIGSPTFGLHDATLQSPESGVAVYLPDGVGHAFLALEDATIMCYLCSEEYVPGTMVEIDAMDPQLALPWGLSRPPLRSFKDANAPTLREAAALGYLPLFEDCVPPLIGISREDNMQEGHRPADVAHVDGT